MKVTEQRLREIVKEEYKRLTEKKKWKNFTQEDMTDWFRKLVGKEKILKRKKVGDFEYFFTDRHSDDDIFIGSVTAFHIPTGYYAGDLTIGKWNAESNEYLEGSVQVHPEFRRQGVATNMYDFAERVVGKKFKPSTKHSSDAKAFWRHRLNRG